MVAHCLSEARSERSTRSMAAHFWRPVPALEKSLLAGSNLDSRGESAGWLRILAILEVVHLPKGNRFTLLRCYFCWIAGKRAEVFKCS